MDYVADSINFDNNFDWIFKFFCFLPVVVQVDGRDALGLVAGLVVTNDGRLPPALVADGPGRLAGQGARVTALDGRRRAGREVDVDLALNALGDQGDAEREEDDRACHEARVQEFGGRHRGLGKLHRTRSIETGSVSSYFS